MPKLIHLISIVMLLSSCSDIQKSPDNETELINAYNPDTLSIQAQFADCGEWGGHIERIDIYRANNSVVALFRRDTVKCPALENSNRRMFEESTINLSKENQVEVVNFLHELVERRFQNEIVSHAGNYYRVWRSNGDLLIKYDDYYMDWKGFEKLKMELINQK